MSHVKKILLIVEDNETIANQMSEILAHIVDECYVALNGKLGLEILNKNPAVSLVVSDVIMPEMNGIEFIKSVRKIKNPVRFIFFSSLGEEILLKEVVTSGPIDYITKPDYEELSYSIEQAFKSNFYQIEEKNSDELIIQIDSFLIDNID